jgi:hypothetical protein
VHVFVQKTGNSGVQYNEMTLEKLIPLSTVVVYRPIPEYARIRVDIHDNGHWKEPES